MFRRRSEQVEERDEVRDDGHIHEQLIAGPQVLAEEHRQQKHRAGGALAENGDVGSLPARVQAGEGGGQIAVEADGERHAGASGEPRPQLAGDADGDQDRNQRRNKRQAHPVRRRRGRLRQAGADVHFAGRQNRQHRQRSGDVKSRDGQPADPGGARDVPLGVSYLAAHDGRYVVDRQTDAVVSDPVLWIVVRANLFRSFTGPYL